LCGAGTGITPSSSSSLSKLGAAGWARRRVLPSHPMSQAPPFQQAFHDLLGGGLPERLRASPIRAVFETAGRAGVIEGRRGFAPPPGRAPALAQPAAPPPRQACVLG